MPTVTVFSHTDALTSAMVDAIVSRGSSAHVVSVPWGWPTTSNRAVLRLDSAAGRAAIEQLVGVELPVEVVVLSTGPLVGDLAQWCEDCEPRHHLTRLSIDADDLRLPQVVADQVVGAA